MQVVKTQQLKRVTLKDIAERTGFTINTVSRALKNKDDISDETKEVIRTAAENLGYVNDVIAGALRSGFTKTIAVIVGDITNPFFGSLVRDIEIAGENYGYSIIIFNSDENSKRERDAILSAYSKRVDGIIICPVQENDENVKLLQKIGIPFVLLGRYFKDIPTDSVVWNDTKAGELVTKYFIECGHVRILYIGGPACISSAEERLRDYRNAHVEAGLPVDERLVRTTNITTGSCKKEIDYVLGEEIPFTAVVAFSDLMAYEVMYEFKKVMVAPRNNVPIAAFDNIGEKIMLPVSFPSVGCCEDEAARAVELLFNKIHEKINHHPVHIALDVKLHYHN